VNATAIRPRGSNLDVTVVGLGILLIGASAATGKAPGLVAPAVATLVLFVTTRLAVIEWRAIFLGLLLIILFIPIRRYSLAINLPFQLEPYRLYVILMAAVWATFLLLDRRLRIRAMGMEGPFALLGIAVLGSIVTNFNSITHEDLSAEVVKKLTFWVGFMVVLYMLASLSSRADVDLYLRSLVLGTALLGALGVVEWKTGMNVFAHLDRYVPFIAPVGDQLDTFRAGLNRAYGSAQHPIAFGAALALVLPIAVVLAFRRRKPIWFASVALILMGTLASISRTSLIMVAVGAVVLALVKPRAAREAVPFILPLLVAIQIALPGSLSTVRAQFFPSGGLVKEQAAAQAGSGRVASFGPAVDEASRHPFFGRGFGTRIVEVTNPHRNSFILDDEWLSSTLEVGLVGVIAWVWIFGRFCSRAVRAARAGDEDDHWLLAGLAASVASFAVGMAFFDAFSFIQVTFIAIIVIGLGSVLLRDTAPGRSPAPQAR
jgi:O-antigen ligase